jgi:hypothetical protein
MAQLLQSKQIEDYKIGKMGIIGFAASGTSNVVTPEITAAAASDGVPVQVGTSNTEGFITTGANNKALLVDNVTKGAIDDGEGNEVFGRLTEAAGVYTLSYFSIQSGVESPVTLPATTIDFFVNYNYSFKNLPNDILVRVNGTIVGEDPSSTAGRPIRNEKVTVTALNTLADLSFTPIDNSVALYVNGKAETEGASESFTRVGKVLTWDAIDAGYDLETTDDVTAHYNTLEAA